MNLGGPSHNNFGFAKQPKKLIIKNLKGKEKKEILIYYHVFFKFVISFQKNMKMNAGLP